MTAIRIPALPGGTASVRLVHQDNKAREVLGFDGVDWATHYEHVALDNGATITLTPTSQIGTADDPPRPTVYRFTIAADHGRWVWFVQVPDSPNDVELIDLIGATVPVDPEDVLAGRLLPTPAALPNGKWLTTADGAWVLTDAPTAEDLPEHTHDPDLNPAFTTATIGTAPDVARFGEDGTLTFEGSATAWEDMGIPGFSVRGGASPPDFAGGFAGSATLYAHFFNGVNTLEEVYFSLQAQHAWKEGSRLWPHVHFSPASTNGADTGERAVRFVLEYAWANVDGIFGAPATIEMTAAFVPNASQWAHLIAHSQDGMDATGKTISNILMCRLYRDPANAGDTYPQDVALLSFDIHYEIDAMGSAVPMSKTAPV